MNADPQDAVSTGEESPQEASPIDLALVGAWPPPAPPPPPEPHGPQLDQPDADGWRRLAREVQLTWFLGSLVRMAVVGGLAAAADFFWLRRPGFPLAQGVLSAVVIAWQLVLTVVWPFLRYRTWRFAIRRHDVLLRYGVLWQVRRSIPRLRVQHIDVTAGPFERLFGLAHLTLFTAGVGDADSAIPGLRAAEAEALRERLLREDWADA